MINLNRLSKLSSSTGSHPYPILAQRISLRLCLLFFILFSITASRAQSQTYKDLHDFGGIVLSSSGGSVLDGQDSLSPITFDSAGNMYGTANDEAINGAGMVWELTASGKYIDLHDFGGMVTNADGSTGLDGVHPQGNVAVDGAGNIYGTTQYGGPNSNGGMVWKITAGGVYVDLHDFGSGLDGSGPVSGVTLDASGNMYGATLGGGFHVYDGMLWKLTPSGVYTDLHDFGGSVSNSSGPTGADGNLPCGAVVFDTSGNMYGTAFGGGAYGYGIVWEYTSTGSYIDLHDFGTTFSEPGVGTVQDGKSPNSSVSFDATGNIWGTTNGGGANGTSGIIWELQPGGVYYVVHNFGGTTTNANGTSGADGANPISAVVFDSAGSMYGTTSAGGPTGGAGMVWEITAAGVYMDLHDFGGQTILNNGTTGSDGSNSNASVSVDINGNVYGTTKNGAIGGGMIFKFTPPPPMLVTLTLSPSTVVGGTSTTGTINLSSPAIPQGVTVNLASNNGGITTNSSVTIHGGYTSATFNINTVAVSTVVTAKIAATYSGVSLKTGITVDPSPTLVGVTLNPATVFGTGSTTGTATISEPALAGGVTVYLSSNNGGITVPASVTVLPGAMTATFSVNTVIVSTVVTAKISGTIDNVNVIHTPITVDPLPVLVSVTLSPSTVFGGTSTTGTVTLSEPALTGGVTVYLSSNNVGITLPASVTVPNGSASATFTVNSVPVSSTVTAKIAATLDNVNVLHTGITVEPSPVLTGVSLSPATVTGGFSTTGTVTINEPALTGGVVVYVSSNNAGITMNATATIPEGSTSGTFTVNTIAVSTTVTAKVAATLDNINVLRTGITVNPPSLQSVSVTPTSVQGSSATVVKGTVTLTGVAPVGATVISLSSSDPSVTVPATVTVFGGNTTVTFLVGHTTVSTVTTVTITATLGGVSQTTTLTVNP